MMKKIVVVLAVLIIAFCVYVQFQPGTFRVERNTVIDAPADVVFDLINDFHQWQTWSPWSKRDPNAVYTYEGPLAGAGSVLKWSGNREIGVGKATIVESNPGTLIRIKLDFIQPFAATNMAEFQFRVDGPRTLLNWSMTGENSFMSKLFSVFMNVDQMVGKEFEQGLASIKAASESQKK